MQLHGMWLDEDRALLRDLFKALRKDGFRARMNFTCCTGCGSYEISENPPKFGVTPYVFYHHQNTDDMHDGKALHLSYGYTTTVLKDAPPQLEEVLMGWIGRLICRQAMALGLGVDWDGSPRTKVMVYPKHWEVADAA